MDRDDWIRLLVVGLMLTIFVLGGLFLAGWLDDLDSRGSGDLANTLRAGVSLVGLAFVFYALWTQANR